MEADTKFEEKILETDRLRLVRIRAETHVAELNRVICDTFDTLSPWMVWCKTKPTVEETITGLCMMTNSSTNYVFNLYLREEPKTLIGNCCLRKQDGDGCYEIGYWLHGAYTGRGFMTECVQGLVEFARHELTGVSILSMYVHQGNEGSRRVAEKVGMKFVRNVDFTYEATRPEWGTRVNHCFELQL